MRKFLREKRWRHWRPLWPWQLALGVSLWLAGPGNLPLWLHLGGLDEFGGWRGVALGAGLALLIGCLLMLLLSLLSWPRLWRPASMLLLLMAAVGAHFMLSYGIVIDPGMLTNVLQTDPAEARDLLSARMLLTVLLFGALPAGLVWLWPQRSVAWHQRTLHNLWAALVSTVLAALVLWLVFQDLAPLMRNHKQVRYMLNPLNSVYALGRAVAGERAHSQTPLQPLGRDAQAARPAPAGRTPLLLLALGETARSDHFSLNGYARDTNPRLAALDVISWTQVMSCGTSTAASLPCMFSHLGREAFVASDARHENLLDVLQHAGWAVLWLDNQSGCKGQCDRVPTVDAAALARDAACPSGECMDEVMLQRLDERIAALDPARRQRGVVVVMHQMGSHGPAYHKRSSAGIKRFHPECQNANLAACERQAVVNAYDNSLLQTDHFLAEAIGWLRARESRYAGGLLYLSDHGESLGEGNLYLHGVPYAIAPVAQKHVPMIAWHTPALQAWRGLDMACLRARRSQPLSHDHLFHSVLGLLDIRTAAYRPELDLHAGCVR